MCSSAEMKAADFILKELSSSDVPFGLSRCATRTLMLDLILKHKSRVACLVTPKACRHFAFQWMKRNPSFLPPDTQDY